MPGGLTASGPRWPPAVALLGQPALAVLVGWLWSVFWSPPTGVAFDGRFVPVGEAGYRAFSATGSYVLWCLAAGLLAGAAVALVRRGELLLLGGGVVGSVAAAVVVAGVGGALGPPDPQLAAQQSGDFSTVPVALEVVGWTAYLAWPVGFLAAMLVVLLWLEPWTHARAG